MSKFPNKEEYFKENCKNYEMSLDFVREFREFITPEILSSGNNLQYLTIRVFDELFDINIWSKCKTKSLEPLTHPEFMAKYSDYISEALEETDLTTLNIESFNAIRGLISVEVLERIINTTNFAKSLDFLIENANFLNEKIFRIGNIDFTWTEENILQVVNSGKIKDVASMLNAVGRAKLDSTMLQILNTNMKLSLVSNVDIPLMKVIIDKINPNNIGAFLKFCIKYGPQTLITSTILGYVLANKEVDEDVLVEYASYFFREGLSKELKAYAKLRDYESVLSLEYFQ